LSPSTLFQQNGRDKEKLVWLGRKHGHKLLAIARLVFGFSPNVLVVLVTISLVILST